MNEFAMNGLHYLYLCATQAKANGAEKKKKNETEPLKQERASFKTPVRRPQTHLPPLPDDDAVKASSAHVRKAERATHTIAYALCSGLLRLCGARARIK